MRMAELQPLMLLFLFSVVLYFISHLTYDIVNRPTLIYSAFKNDRKYARHARNLKDKIFVNCKREAARF